MLLDNTMLAILINQAYTVAAIQKGLKILENIACGYRIMQDHNLVQFT